MGIYLNNQNNLFFSLLLCLLLTSYTVNANTEAEYLYQSGLDLYEKGKFEDSIEKLESAVKLEPNIAKYHHILAKGCGRQAESSSWFKAMKLAKKTLLHLELATELDANNIEILRDLAKYYLEAPIFLGGSRKKANEINDKIKEIHSKNE